jgi:hypothetical protein
MSLHQKSMHNRTPLERLVVESRIDENTLSVLP